MPIEQKLAYLGLALPQPLVPPASIKLPFHWVRVHGDKAYVSGHVPQHVDGTVAGPFGKVGLDVTIEAAYEAARLTTLGILASLQRELGDLDRVTAWLRIFGMVNSARGFVLQPKVIDGCSDLVVQLYGPVIGAHARAAVGMAELPLGVPVEIEAQVAFKL